MTPSFFTFMALAFSLDSFSLGAQTLPSENPRDKVLIIEESHGKKLRGQEPEAKVETGTTSLAGSFEPTRKAAERTWDQRCREWKSELRALNGKNLMIVDCGVPKASMETEQSEKTYRMESTGSYKIRITTKAP